MSYVVASLLGGVLTVGLFSRILMVALRGMGDGPARIYTASGIAYVLGVALYSFLTAGAGPWNPGLSWLTYAVAAALWIMLDFRGRKNRSLAKPEAQG